MTDKNYCMSSYLAFRYIERDGADFYDGMRHRNIELPPESGRTAVRTAGEIGVAIERQLAQFRGKRVGVMLSGGMDSAIVASYVPGAEAYTFRFLGGEFQGEELSRAERYARQYGLRLHHVDISWQTVESHVDDCMRRKCAPVHSIEPQLLQAALQAKADGVEVLLVGESADLVFGGMDKLLAKDWTMEEFAQRYTFTDPRDVLKNPVSMDYVFERYLHDGKFDFLTFMDEIFSVESSGSYYNAFAVAGMPYYDPYARLRMAEPLDLCRVRSGEPKYLIRELMASRYPGMGVPDKNPMPRPVDTYFAGWEGPRRPEFRKGLDMAKFTGNQKWQMWCLERWLNMNEGR